MQTPNNIAGEITEKIMNRIAGLLNPNPVLKNVDTRTYNRLYSEVYSVLDEYLVEQSQTATDAHKARIERLQKRGLICAHHSQPDEQRKEGYVGVYKDEKTNPK